MSNCNCSVDSDANIPSIIYKRITLHILIVIQVLGSFATCNGHDLSTFSPDKINPMSWKILIGSHEPQYETVTKVNLARL